MTRTALALALAALAACMTPGAAEAFGISAWDGYIAAGEPGGAFTQAGGHPYEVSSTIRLNEHPDPLNAGKTVPDGSLKDASGDLPAGLVGDPAGVPVCTSAQLVGGTNGVFAPDCPVASQIGINFVDLGSGFAPFPLFNMQADGVVSRWGANVAGVLVFYDASLRSDGDYGVRVTSRNISQAAPFVGDKLVVWGTPASSAHDGDRCAQPHGLSSDLCETPHSAGVPAVPYITMPTRCTAPGEGLRFSLTSDFWQEPGAFVSPSVFYTHEAPGYPEPQAAWGAPVGVEGCDIVPFEPTIAAQSTEQSAESPSGFEVTVKLPTDGLLNPSGVAQSEVKKAVVSLPQGVTLNPSEATGLHTCSPEDYAASSVSGSAGCPADSKIGTVEVKTPLLDHAVEGSVYVASPQRNPFDSLLAVYVVIRDPQTGVLIKLPIKVEPDEKTGRIVATVEDVPQLPFESFAFKFREGARAPLVTPPACGDYETEARFTSWARPGEAVAKTSTFRIGHGVGGGPCPPGGTPEFKPGFSAGSINNNAGSHTDFDMRITRKDGEQDMTRFSAVLPPGVLGKLAGVEKCPDSAIAAAQAHNGPHGGTEEIEHPSCPANSQIGRSIVGAGVGSVLTYVPGKVYLGGPFHGDPLSVIAITPVVAGPFDVGTVVVHEALTLNPQTAEVEVDGSASDPIPHILKGIPAKLRDLRVYVDKPDFILNPTSCDPSQTTSTLFGSGANVFNTLDDVPVSLSDRFQAASCQSLGFKPRLGLKLKGGTKRGRWPGLQAVYRPREGNANAEGLTVRLPRSAFLEQAHIRTICTRVQYAAKACPEKSRYGYIRAWTPLLDEPLQGPVYLRSSNHKLPDLVFDLHGLVDIEVATRIDSIRGGVRATVNDIPDAPLSKVVLRMQGGKKGLIVNSRNLCFKPKRNRANSAFTGQNGKQSTIKPVLRAVSCAKHRKHKRHHRRAARVARASAAGQGSIVERDRR